MLICDHFGDRPLPRRASTVGAVSLLAVFGSALAAAPAFADSAVAWGFNSAGQLGIGPPGSVLSRLSPVPVNGLASGVSAVAAGSFFSLAIQNGAALAWGGNGNGQIGNGALTNVNVPVQVTGLTSGVTAIAGGNQHALAIQSGGVLAWGLNSSGQLGDGTLTRRTSPVPVTGLTSGVTAIAAGTVHSLALQNGAVSAWGNNNFGQLGNGTIDGSATPVPVSGLGSGVTAIFGAGFHSMAIRNGAVWAWGNNTFGKLGDGTTNNASTPVQVSGLTSGVTAIAGGVNHSLAIQNGDVFAWGSNAFGQLGTGGSASDVYVPTRVLDLPVNLVAVAATNASSFALSSDGSLWAWGSNSLGQLGLGDTTNRLTPTQLFAPAGYVFTSIDGDAVSSHVVATIALVPSPGATGLLFVGGLIAQRRRTRT
jgi:alpha-tubulin suppressor-like RCC1 family protein